MRTRRRTSRSVDHLLARVQSFAALLHCCSRPESCALNPTPPLAFAARPPRLAPSHSSPCASDPAPPPPPGNWDGHCDCCSRTRTGHAPPRRPSARGFRSCAGPSSLVLPFGPLALQKLTCPTSTDAVLLFPAEPQCATMRRRPSSPHERAPNRKPDLRTTRQPRRRSLWLSSSF